jgi:hypothetical protein
MTINAKSINIISCIIPGVECSGATNKKISLTGGGIKFIKCIKKCKKKTVENIYGTNKKIDDKIILSRIGLASKFCYILQR